jgi:molybdopterin-guanine dinucleotide biosynthesis protein A
MNPRVAGVVLAGGLSRRMGVGDKTLLQLGSRSMLAHVVDRLLPQVETIALNANGDAERFSQFGLPVLSDPVEGFAGPLAGVLAGLNWAIGQSGVTHIVTAAGDTPFFPGNLAEKFLDANEGHFRRIVLAQTGGRRHPVFGLWPTALRDDLAEWMKTTETYKVLAWVDRHDSAVAEFGPVTVSNREIDPFFNANTPQDLSEAEQLLRETTS